MIIQAGAFGEHCSTTATFAGIGTVVRSHCLCLVCSTAFAAKAMPLPCGPQVEVGGRYLQLNLAAGAQVEIELGVVLHANTDPSYLRPWDTEGEQVPPQAQSIRSLARTPAARILV